MSLLISPTYLELQKELHNRGSYGVSAGKWGNAVNYWCEKVGAKSLLDYGCGKGLLGQVLSRYSYEVREYDPAIDGKTDTPEPADVVFCGDVLEHIEPCYLENVLDDLARVTKTVAFLVIATCPASKVLADGRNAHLIVQPAWWWMMRLQERWVPASFGGDVSQFQWIGWKRSE